MARSASSEDTARLKYVDAVRQYLQAEQAGDDLSGTRLRANLLDAAVRFALSADGRRAVASDTRLARTQRPASLIAGILALALQEAKALSPVRTAVPANTYPARLETAAVLHAAAEHARQIAERTGLPLDEEHARTAGRRWEEAEAAVHQPVPGDLYSVTGRCLTPIGTGGTLLRVWRAEHGLRLLLVTDTGQEFWVSPHHVVRR
jgi:hypothetical protein